LLPQPDGVDCRTLQAGVQRRINTKRLRPKIDVLDYGLQFIVDHIDESRRFHRSRFSTQNKWLARSHVAGVAADVAHFTEAPKHNIATLNCPLGSLQRIG
jgi:hypothetical protein